jgi:SagB-type dehydrogenase family enzyme
MRAKSPAGPAPAAPVSALRPDRFSDIQGQRVSLPAASAGWSASFQDVLARRRSVRDYSESPLNLEQVARLLWAAQGVSGVGGLRTAPSAGAFYPLRTYVFAFRVTGLAKGLYRYAPDSHELETLGRGDRRKRLVQSASGQECASECAIMVLLTADLRRMQREFGDTSRKLAFLEAGHAAQNFLHAATAQGLGAIGIGRFDESIVQQTLELPDTEEPMYLLLAGLPR